jgi:cyanophycinase
MRTSRCVVCALLAALVPSISLAQESTAENVFGLPAGAVEKSGALVIAGGGDLPEAVYEEFVRLAGGKQARLVLIPSAYDYGSMNRIRSAFGGWREYDVESFDFLHTDDRHEAETAAFSRVLARATGVWIAGGAQARLTRRYGQTRVEELLRKVLERGGVVGGTSAGASVMSELMISDGSKYEAVLDRGFCLSSKLVIDQHFSERGRFPRLLGVLEENLGHIGLGIDEDTAVIVQHNRMRVLGEGWATICFGPVRKGEGTVVYRLEADEEAEISCVSEDKGTVAFDLKRR